MSVRAPPCLAFQQRRALRPQGVNFVHKNQARSVDARALEEISYPRRTDTDNDFDEF